MTTSFLPRLSRATLYCILDLGYVAAERVEFAADAMIAGGADVIQLRAKGLPEAEVLDLARRVEPIIQGAGVPFVVNDHPRIARACGAAGVHWGLEDGPLAVARAESGAEIVGRSTHGVDQAIAAAAEGANYIGFGPLFPTPTKPGRPAIGLDDIRRVRDRVSIPVFCIGGIKHDNLAGVIAAGANRVVIVSGILQAPDIAAACRQAKAVLAGV